MSTKDILKNSFLESLAASDVRPQEIFMVLFITTVLALYIFCVYRVLTRKTFYNKSFNIALAALALITAGVILTIQSSIVVSLGMVGALSIVRFRTAVKEPMDLCFLFWSIAVGICCGAHMTEIALVLSLILTMLVIVLDRLPIGRAPMILVANLDTLKKEEEFMKIVGTFCRYYRVKSRNLSKGRCNLVLEVRAREEYEMMQKLDQIEGLESVSLVSHDGEVTF